MTAREMFIKLGYKYSFDTFNLGGTSNFISYKKNTVVKKTSIRCLLINFL